MGLYEKLFISQREEYYRNTGINPNAVLMQPHFALKLSLETNIQINDGKMFRGIEIILVYNTKKSNNIQFFRRINK